MARSALGAPFGGAVSPNGLTEGVSFIGRTNPSDLVTLGHLPFQGRHGRFAPHTSFIFRCHHSS